MAKVRGKQPLANYKKKMSPLSSDPDRREKGAVALNHHTNLSIGVSFADTPGLNSFLQV